MPKKLTFTDINNRFHKSRKKKSKSFFIEKEKQNKLKTKCLSKINANTSQIVSHFHRNGKLADELLFKDSFSLAKT